MVRLNYYYCVLINILISHYFSMDSESDISTASDDGGGKKKEMKKSIFVKKKQNEGVDDNVKSSKSKNPLPTTHVKNQQIVKSVQKKRKADTNLNNIKMTNVVSLLYSCFRISKKIIPCIRTTDLYLLPLHLPPHLPQDPPLQVQVMDPALKIRSMKSRKSTN